MPDSPAKKQWIKEHTVSIGIRLQKKTDSDIIEYLEDRQKQTEIKKALRFYIAHKEEAEKWEEK